MEDRLPQNKAVQVHRSPKIASAFAKATVDRSQSRKFSYSRHRKLQTVLARIYFQVSLVGKFAGDYHP